MSDDRKSRLAALAAKAGRHQQTVGSDGTNAREASVGVGVGVGSKPTLSFRNYVPKDASLRLADASSSSAAHEQQSKRRKKTSDDRGGGTSSADAPGKSALESALARTGRESREAAGQNVGTGRGGWSDVTPVSTMKVNSDLKRDIRHRMDKLERRTQRAIVELLRGRLEREAAEGGDDDMEEDSDLD